MASGTTQDLVGVWGSSDRDVFAVGSFGAILRYEGTSWSPMPSGASESLLDVSATSPSEVIVGGNGGTILRSRPI